MTPIIYTYEPETRHYTGTSKADPDPLDASNWLVPAYATLVAVGEDKPDHVQVFDEATQVWTYQFVQPLQPSPAHDWDAKKQTWMLNKARAAELKEAEKNAQVTAAIEAVRAALKAAINVQFEALNARLGADFKDADVFTVYAGFENAFQREAAAFGAWTALVWKTANEYKAQVMAGKAPMLSPDEAVKMMPEFKVAS